MPWGAENSRHGFGGTLSLSFFCLLLAFRRVLFNLFWREDLTGRRQREEQVTRAWVLGMMDAEHPKKCEAGGGIVWPSESSRRPSSGLPLLFRPLRQARPKACLCTSPTCDAPTPVRAPHQQANLEAPKIYDLFFERRGSRKCSWHLIIPSLAHGWVDQQESNCSGMQLPNGDSCRGRLKRQRSLRVSQGREQKCVGIRRHRMTVVLTGF